MEYIYVCRCQESTFDVCEAIISNNWKVDHGSERNYMYPSDRLEPANVESDNSVNW